MVAKRVHRQTGFVQVDRYQIVECPRCAAQAEIRKERFTCATCGLAKSQPLRFDAPLWLQTNCCGYTLWACNLEHVSVMESYVAADLRERRKHPKWGWSNGALESRLPRWMVLAKNRDAVLKGLKRLRERALVLK